MSTHFIISIGGNGVARYEISKPLKYRGWRPLDLISKSSILDNLNKFGDSINSMPGSILHKFTEFGDLFIFNTNSIVNYDCILGNWVHIMGSASV